MRVQGGISYLLVIAPFVAPVFVCCSSMGTFALVEARRDAGRVETAVLADRDRAPTGSRVSTRAGLVLVGEEPHGAGRLFSISGEAEVLAYCPSDCGAWTDGTYDVRGRICDRVFVSSVCHEESQVAPLLDEIAGERGIDPSALRVLRVEGDGATWMGIVCTFGAALGLALLVLAGLVAVMRDGRKGGPRIARDRAWQLAISVAELEERLRGLTGDGARVVERGAASVVIAQGRTERSARMWGLRAPGDMPRRVEVRWSQAGGPYGTLQVEARATEELEWLGQPGEVLERLSAESLDRTLAQLERALGAAPPT